MCVPVSRAGLSSDEGDRRLERELRPDKQLHEDVPKTPYEFQVHTGGIGNAGTDANVFVQLFGDKGKTDEMKLDNSSVSSSTNTHGIVDAHVLTR